MTGISLLRAADRRAQLWKNGGGVTTDVMVHPPGSGMDDFAWRISIAEITVAGPFSHFEGIDRVLTILDGELDLAIDGEPDVHLTPETAPRRFPGEAPAYGAPINGPVRDINVMFRRGLWSGNMNHIQIDKCGKSAANWQGVIVACNDIIVSATGWKHSLSSLDAIFVHSPQDIHLMCDHQAAAIMICLLERA